MNPDIIEHMKRERKILHVDLDAFFCAVEELADPNLRGKPFAVGGSADGRGVVSSCSYPARRMGVRSAMPMARAIRLCPGLIVIPVRHGDYSAKSREVMAILSDMTPLTERVSVDEAFLDVSDLPDPLETIAAGIQRRIREETSLPSSFGGGTNPLIAKIANDVGKKSKSGRDYPCAIQCVPAGQEKAFLAPLKTTVLWGIGEKTAAALRNMGIVTIGQLAATSERALIERFGRYGIELYRHANGIDSREIRPEAEDPKSVSQETTFETDVSDRAVLLRRIRRQSDQVGYRLRRGGLAGNTVKIKLRWANFVTIVRQMKVDPPINQDSAIYETAAGLFSAVWETVRDPVRLIGVGVSGFESRCGQLTFLDPPEERKREGELLKAVDEIRLRYGRGSLLRASELGGDRRISPDDADG